MSIGLNNKVDAINQVLAAIGSVGINSEEELEWNVDAGDADKLIDTLSKEVQTNMGKGWWFNREEFHKLTPDPVTGNVVVPTTTISCLVKRSAGKVLPITLRGNLMFDTKELGYDMSSLVNANGKIECILVMELGFDTLPSTAKTAVTDLSRYWMVNDKEGDTVKLQSLATKFQASLASLAGEDSSQKRRNMFSNPFVADSIAKAGGYNNN